MRTFSTIAFVLASTALANAGLVTVSTKAGPITVASDAASKFQGFINALPFTPKSIGCYAHGGHIHGSLHYSGHACDIDQLARNRTRSEMYHISALASQFGLRDGCSFHDCGHVDTGESVRIARHRTIQLVTYFSQHRYVILRYHHPSHGAQ